MNVNSLFIMISFLTNTGITIVGFLFLIKYYFLTTKGIHDPTFMKTRNDKLINNKDDQVLFIHA